MFAKIMDARHYISAIRPIAAIFCICLAPACAGLERLAPPGLIKYENLAGDQPPNPEIQARIDDRAKQGAGKYPVLSAQPSERPEAMTPAEREELTGALIGQRDNVASEIEIERAAAAAEREAGALLPGEKARGLRPLEDTRDALSDAVARDTAAAAQERTAPATPGDQ